MSSSPVILSIDQGTTSSRAMLFDQQGKSIAVSQKEYKQLYPQEGWVEHNPDDIWQTTLTCCQEVMRQSPGAITCIGITNQRETTLIWNRKTGKPVHNAIVWQDRRTADYCAKLKQDGYEATITEKTGLLPDPYFSASKIHWILEQVPYAREQAERGELAFGTVDTFLLWKLTNGQSHLTDITNASRTMLFNIHTGEWDKELLSLFDIPASLLPEVKPCTADFGITSPDITGQSIPITGIAGDQQAASIGQACFSPGMTKSTYGTGCFMLINTGEKAYTSQHRLLTTIAYQLDGKITYALEGSVFVAGAAIQWLRDKLTIFTHAQETEALAASLDGNKGVYIVPAFTGLGCPHWTPHTRGTIFGLTRNTGKAELVRATLESIAYQSYDLLTAMHQDGVKATAIRTDGGMAYNNWFMQFLADMTDTPIKRSVINETTALGAAYLAGLQQGIFSSPDDITTLWREDRAFIPSIDEGIRNHLLQQWQKAIQATCQFYGE